MKRPSLFSGCLQSLRERDVETDIYVVLYALLLRHI